MEILKANRKDLSQILALQYKAYESEAVRYNDFTIPPMTQTLAQLKEEALSSVILKAAVNNVIVGSVRGRASSKSCEIGRLIVDPNFQRQGIGTALLLTIETYFPDINHFTLFTGIESEDNIRLYKKNGYQAYKTKILNDRITLMYLEKNRDQ